MSEFVVNGETYRSAKMSAMKQFSVSRRLLPVLATLKEIPAMAEGAALDPTSFLEPMARAVAQMPDEDCTFVLAECLSVTQRKQSGDMGWVTVWNRTAGEPQMDDIDMLAMLNIAARVLGDNFQTFFPAVKTGLSGAT